MENLNIKKLVSGTLAFVFAIATLFSTIFTIPAGSVGVVTRFGAVERVAYPGIGVKIPWVEGVKKMTVQTQKDQVDASSASKDLQVVTATIAVNYHLDGAFATNIYQDIGLNYRDIVIDPATQNTFKATTAQYTAEELITKREEVRLVAEKALEAQLQPYHIQVENFNIVNFDFSPEFNDAIEKKQVAQQNVETERQNLEKAKVMAEQTVAAARGQADAQKALKDSGALSPEYLQYLALTKWDGRLPLFTGSATPFIDVSSFLSNATSSPQPPR